MKVTYYDYSPGGGRSLHVRNNLHNLEIKKSGDGYGPFVFAEPGDFLELDFPLVIICRAEDLYKVEEE